VTRTTPLVSNVIVKNVVEEENCNFSTGCSEFHFCSYISSKWEFFSFSFSFLVLNFEFLTKFFPKTRRCFDTFLTAQNLGETIVPSCSPPPFLSNNATAPTNTAPCLRHRCEKRFLRLFYFCHVFTFFNVFKKCFSTFLTI